MPAVRYLEKYKTVNSIYHLLAVVLPFRGEENRYPADLPSVISASHLLNSYLDFIKPKGEEWVQDIKIRSDPGTVRKQAGLDNSHDLTYIGVTEDGDVVASFTIYSSLLDPQVGLVCHVRTHEDHRQRGLSSRLGIIAHDEWYENNPERMLILHVTNPAAHKIYKKFGYTTLVGRIAEKDRQPGEMMARPCNEYIDVKSLIEERYNACDELSVREIQREDIAGFVTLIAAEGTIDVFLKKYKMENANKAEDSFTMTMLNRDDSQVYEGMFCPNGVLKGIKSYSIRNPEDVEIFMRKVR